MENEVGLSTREALQLLYREIQTHLVQFNIARKRRLSCSWIKDTLHHASKKTNINWIALTLLTWCAISLILAYNLSSSPYNESLWAEAFVIIFFTLSSVVLELYDSYLRHYEVSKRVESVLHTIQRETDGIEWSEENYPSLFMPTSPCITLQWTYRDGNLVNLPWALLVKGDVIFIRPGQQSPGYCESLNKNCDQPLLHMKEIFSPSFPDKNEVLNAPRIRKPLKGCKYRLLETPYLNNLKIILEQALDRPITYYNNQRHILFTKMIQRLLLPLIIILFYGVSLSKFVYFRKVDGVQLFLLVPTGGLLPLLPMVFPIAWNVLNYIGMSRFQALFDIMRSEYTKGSLSLEEDTDNSITESIDIKHNWKRTMVHFVNILKGHPNIMVRSGNILHILGSVTALCCVDKKGVLSWPNPTAEKVFFLHNNETESPASSLGNFGDLDADSLVGTPLRRSVESPCRGASVEVLDLTHSHQDPFILHFDDQTWKKHLPSLKPLGLAILLNTCNSDTEEQYASFCSHIACETMHSENLVPVPNRRCLCQLAKEIGFVEQAEKIFSLEQKLCTFKNLQAENVRRDNKYARSLCLSNSRLKFPFPHMFAVIVREMGTGAMQLLSEGTVDVLLDSCIDYWDGKDLCPLNSSDRKRIQDFYQRCSLTAYCTAFSYRPLNRVPTLSLASSYLELPSDSRHLFVGHRSPTPLHWDRGVLEPNTDSLLYGCEFETEEIDADGYFQMQCNQVFIGMVSMQYQVLSDMVHLIEQLERACIRFVHFSKENELRSRVFSEKMGLESGWNCHISLLSERNSNLEGSRAMSFSAPSAINIDQPVVRFDTELAKHCSDQSSVHESKDIKSDESNAATHHTSHDWQSMSCLTDSTDQSAPVNFDMSNRARLPRGIDKIRPHIELIDNVPLLVSLFTDCTPVATREMLHIMQDYGEIVCVVGSAANCENVGIFMQADASVAVEPLYPQICQRRTIYRAPSKECISPLELAKNMNSLASSLSIKREEPLPFYRLIMESRHFLTSLWNVVQFWICSCAVLTTIQLCCALFLLPPPLSTGHILWLTCVIIPVISGTLLALPVDPSIMKIPFGKNHLSVNLDVLVFVFWCYGLRFLPTILTALITFGGILSHHCIELCAIRNCTCFFHHTPMILGDNKTLGWADTSWTIVTARLMTFFIIQLHFVVISIGFVHRNHSIWQRSPHRNKIWLSIICAIFLTHSLYFVGNFVLLTGRFDNASQFYVPLWINMLLLMSPFLIYIINESIKLQEIRFNERLRKRTRLDFGTKLGMNSPF